MYVLTFSLNMIPMTVAGVWVQSRKMSHFACDIHPLCLSPILASKYYNKKDVVNFVVTSIKHYFHISCLSPWRLMVGQVNHNYLHQYKHYWWAYTQTWRQGLSSIYSSRPVHCTAPFVCTNKLFGRSSEWICFNFFLWPLYTTLHCANFLQWYK